MYFEMESTVLLYDGFCDKLIFLHIRTFFIGLFCLLFECYFGHAPFLNLQLFSCSSFIIQIHWTQLAAHHSVRVGLMHGSALLPYSHAKHRLCRMLIHLLRRSISIPHAENLFKFYFEVTLHWTLILTNHTNYILRCRIRF